jgi:hypothetical protein
VFPDAHVGLYLKESKIVINEAVFIGYQAILSAVFKYRFSQSASAGFPCRQQAGGIM